VLRVAAHALPPRAEVELCLGQSALARSRGSVEGELHGLERARQVAQLSRLPLLQANFTISCFSLADAQLTTPCNTIANLDSNHYVQDLTGHGENINNNINSNNHPPNLCCIYSSHLH